MVGPEVRSIEKRTLVFLLTMKLNHLQDELNLLHPLPTVKVKIRLQTSHQG